MGLLRQQWHEGGSGRTGLTARECFFMARMWYITNGACVSAKSNFISSAMDACEAESPAALDGQEKAVSQGETA